MALGNTQNIGPDNQTIPVGTWVDQIGTWGASGGLASCSSLTGGVGISTVTFTTANVIIDVTPAWTSGNCGIVFRYQDSTNYLIAYLTGTLARVDKVIAGTPTNVISAAGAYGAGRVLRVITDGNAIRLYYNNALIGTGTITNFATSVVHGIYTTNTTATFDNFCVWARGSGNEYGALDAPEIYGRARLTVATSQTKLGKGDVIKATTKTILGVARTTISTVKTFLGKARVTAVNSQIIQGLARVTISTLVTIFGEARVQIFTTKTLPGVSHVVLGLKIQTINGLSRITASISKNILGESRIEVITKKLQLGISRITAATQKTILGRSRIEISTQKTFIGLSRITVHVLKTILGLARITASTIKTIRGNGDIFGSAIKTKLGKSRITIQTSKTIQGISQIRVVVKKLMYGLARITVITQKHILGKAYIMPPMTPSVETGTVLMSSESDRTILASAHNDDILN